VCKLRIASTERQLKDGQWVDGDTTFIDVVAWRSLAENVNSSLAKGQRVTVVGKLRSRSYEKSDGVKVSVFEIEADEVSPSLRNQTVTVEKVKGGTRVKADQAAGMAALKDIAEEVDTWNAPF
jgi:single-strand DNA-binding protein